MFTMKQWNFITVNKCNKQCVFLSNAVKVHYYLEIYKRKQNSTSTTPMVLRKK